MQFDSKQAERIAAKLTQNRWHPNSGVNEAAAMLRAAVEQMRRMADAHEEYRHNMGKVYDDSLKEIRRDLERAEKVVEAARKINEYEDYDPAAVVLHDEIRQALEEYDHEQ